MRNMVLIGAMVLLSTAAAQAGESRSLSLAASDSAVMRSADSSQRTAEMAQPIAAPAAPAAPAAIAPAAAAAPGAAAPLAATPAAATQPPDRMPRRQRAARAPKPRHKRWSEARIVSELHRHGIYW